MSRLVTSHMVENSLSNTRLCHKCAERHSRFSHCASYEGAHQMLTEDLHALCVSSVSTDFWALLLALHDAAKYIITCSTQSQPAPLLARECI